MPPSPSTRSGSASPNVPLEQHNIEIQRNREAWDRKPQLQAIYRDFYRLIATQIDATVSGPIVEIGSGMGRIKDVIPHCITTDLFPNPWLDRQENCYQLSFADASVSHLVLFDVWHHLRYPGTALKEFHRVLAPGGRIIILDPAMSWLGRSIYHYCHHEPIALRDPITWTAPAGFSAADADYYAAQGSASRLFWWGEAGNRLPDWNVLTVRPLNSLEYFATGGFSGPNLRSALLFKFLRGVDALTGPLSRVFAARLLVVLEKKPS